ncbi:hypothetical protein PR048_025736 [Dryococelus australis]|uniref:Uncharacterized protein n=1 Tax=Dryococelus australis TaxID=614101 RepID=A0ABQ9GJF6_9NEOP|nr:hypothetical protein PR048_025736 [Dryococelus australis]
MNSNRCIKEVLELELLLLLQANDSTCHISAGKCPATCGEDCTSLLNERREPTIPWPARSPDISPFENVWTRIQTTCREIPQEHIQVLFVPMPRHLWTLIAARGASHHTEFSRTEIMYSSVILINVLGVAVAERLACSPPTMTSRVHSPAGSLPYFHMWDSCHTMPLGDGFSRGSPVPSALSFRRCSILTSCNRHQLTDYVVKSRPKSFIHSQVFIPNCDTRLISDVTSASMRSRRLFPTWFIKCADMFHYPVPGTLHVPGSSAVLLDRLSFARIRLTMTRSSEQRNECNLRSLLMLMRRHFLGSHEYTDWILQCLRLERVATIYLAFVPLTTRTLFLSTHWGRGGLVVRLLASHQGEPGSIRIFASGNRAGRCCWLARFLCGSLVFPAPSFRRCSILTSLIETSMLKSALISPLRSAKVTGNTDMFQYSVRAEVSVEHRRNEEAMVTGDPRENPPTSGMARQHSHYARSFVRISSTSMFSNSVVYFSLWTATTTHDSKDTIRKCFISDLAQYDMVTRKARLESYICSRTCLCLQPRGRHICGQHGRPWWVSSGHRLRPLESPTSGRSDLFQEPKPALLPPNEPVFNPRLATPGFSHLGIVPGDASGDLDFLGISRFSHRFTPALLYTQLNHPISSQDLAVKSRLNLFTHSPHEAYRKLLQANGHYTLQSELLARLQITEFDCEHLCSPLFDDRPIMDAVEYRVVSGVVWTNRKMARSNIDSNRTSAVAVCIAELLHVFTVGVVSFQYAFVVLRFVVLQELDELLNLLHLRLAAFGASSLQCFKNIF